MGKRKQGPAPQPTAAKRVPARRIPLRPATSQSTTLTDSVQKAVQAAIPLIVQQVQQTTNVIQSLGPSVAPSPPAPSSTAQMNQGSQLVAPPTQTLSSAVLADVCPKSNR